MCKSEAQGMGGHRAAALQNRRNQYTKNTGFVDVTISKVLHYFPHSFIKLNAKNLQSQHKNSLQKQQLF
jgi:hypothetical protein